MKGDRYDQRGLEALLRPKSIAVIGASMKPQRVAIHDAQPVTGGFNGPVMPVTPAWKAAVLEVLAWPTIESLPFTPDLAVLWLPRRNLQVLSLRAKGCKTCIILFACGTVPGV